MHSAPLSSYRCFEAAAISRGVTSSRGTAAGAEVDLVPELPRRGRWAIEIRRSLAPVVTKGFHLGCDDLGAARRFVVYPGGDRFALDRKTEVLSLAALAGELCASA